MNEQLSLWLEKEFYKCNHPKYHKYLKEWISNITDNQIEGFQKMMIGQLEQSKIQH